MAFDIGSMVILYVCIYILNDFPPPSPQYHLPDPDLKSGELVKMASLQGYKGVADKNLFSLRVEEGV